MNIRHGSLFSGIGGFDLAAEWVGWENVFQVEKDEWCRKVLAKNFPASKRYSDIKDFNGKKYTGAVDVISGGFPCQPFSVAGQRKGKSDDRYLWEEMLRVVGEIKPSYVVGENVTGIIGMALDTVLSDLEAQGYTTETFIIPACGKNAWHRRDRVWIVAYANSIRRSNEQKENGELIYNGIGNYPAKKQNRQHQQRRTGKSGIIFSDTTSARAGLEEYRSSGQEREQTNGHEPKILRQENGAAGSERINADSGDIYTDTTEQGFQNRRRTPLANAGETEQEPKRLCGDGKQLQDVADTDNTNSEEQRKRITDEKKFFAPKCSSWWEAEPGMGRVVTRLPNRVDRLKGLGNAIIPQIAYEIFSCLKIE